MRYCTKKLTDKFQYDIITFQQGSVNMAVAEILMTKKECYTIFENGYILMKKGKYTPTKAPIYDVYPKPEKPEPGPTDFVQRNIWGQEIFRENEEILLWRLKCSEIDKISR